MKPILQTAAALALALGLAGACQSGGDAAAAKTADAKPDPRQGEQVSQICFQSQIRNWKANDRRSVIVEKGLREEYKLDLIGSCDPDSAFTSIGLISRMGGGSCLSSGDKLVTDARYNDGSCIIHRIYKWTSKPAEATAASPS
jgi:hypothetical protein